MAFTPTLELLTTTLSDTDQLLCWKYWQLVDTDKRPYYDFVHKVETLAADRGLSARALSALVKSLCQAKIVCPGCQQVQVLTTRNAFIGMFDYFTNPGEGSIRPARCKGCQKEGKGLNTSVEATATPIKAPFDWPVVWPMYPDGRLKSEYTSVQRLLAGHPERWGYYEKLKAHYPCLFLQVTLSAIVPQPRVAHLLQRSPNYFNPGSFHSNRLHFVVCNRNLKPVLAIDCLGEEDRKTHFKRTLLSAVEIPYLFLPKDESLLFSDKVKELLEKTALAEPLYWQREPPGETMEDPWEELGRP